MTIEDAIKKALDGNGILFLGSGFSFGGKNSKGTNLKIGKDLSHAICREIGVKETDDLTISSERYLRSDKLLTEFIDFLSKELYCIETSESQQMIAALPWKRIYTTNYDNAFEVASKVKGYTRKSITIANARFLPNQNLDEAIIHINGSVLKLNEDTFYDEFKITDSSYTKAGLLESHWIELFDTDLERAGAIIFIGYSLKYDQELVRHLGGMGISDKCIFVDISTIDEDSAFRMEQYGTLYLQGTDGFAEEISRVKSTYTPKQINESLIGFIPRKKEMYYTEEIYTIEDIVNFYVKGILRIEYINKKGYCIHRNEKITEIEQLLKDYKVIVIESKLGNGKSVFLECLANRLVDNYDIYFVDNLENMNQDLNNIFKCSDRDMVFMIDDYGNYLHLIRLLGQDFPDNLRLVMTCRSSINSNLYYDLCDKIGFQEGDIQLVNIDRLSSKDIGELVAILNHNRVWGRYDTLSYGRKKTLISKKYNAQVSNLFYIMLNSDGIRQEISKVIDEVKQKRKLFEFVLAQTINNICNLKFAYRDLLLYVGTTDSLLRSYFVGNTNFNNIIDLRENRFVLGSAIYSKYLVKEAGMHDSMLDMLAQIFEKCSEHDSINNKYLQQRKSMVSRSNVLLLMTPDGNKGSVDEKAVLQYYNRIKNLKTATDNPFFWLQYGITALNLNMFELAENNFDSAYANADKIDDFDTFQIDTHKSRLLLCSEMHRNRTDKKSALEIFEKAHELLYKCQDRGERLSYVLRQVDWYNVYYKFYKSIFDDNDIEIFRSKAFEMLEKFEQYFRFVEKNKISNDVLKAYRNYYSLFRDTIYNINFKNVNMLYNRKVNNNKFKI